MAYTHTYSPEELSGLPTFAEGGLPAFDPQHGTGLRTGSLADLYDLRNIPGYSKYASGYRGEDPVDYAALAQQQIAQSGLDPNGQYAMGYVPNDSASGSHPIYQLSNGQWKPIGGYSTTNSYKDSLTQFALGAAALFGGGALLSAYGGAGAGAVGGTGIAPSTAGAATGSGLGATLGPGLTLAAETGTGAGLAAGTGEGIIGAGIGSTIGAGGMSAADYLGKAKDVYNYYNKGKNIIGLLTGGGGEQPAPQPTSQGSGLSGFTPVSHSLNLGNPRLGAAQAQEKAFTEQSYAPVAQEEQRRRLKGLLRQDYV